MLAQYNGNNLGETKVVWYAGTSLLQAGYLVTYDVDDTNAPVVLPAGSLTVPPTSSIQPRNLRGRQVIDPSTATLSAVAGVVAPESGGTQGPAWITIQVPRKHDPVVLHVNISCTQGTTVFIPANGSNLAVAGSDSGYNLPAFAVALQTVDRSSTAGPVLALFI